MRECIEWVQKLSGKIWTDYNEHDPGYTILEQLAYGLTEVGYRMNFDMESLLFLQGGHEEVNKKNALLDSTEALAPGIVTTEDIRRDLIRSFDIVDNAWVERYDSASIEGLYAVYVQLDRGVFPEDFPVYQKRIEAYLKRIRSICEDYHQVRILHPFPVSLKLHLYLERSVQTEHQVASIFDAVSEYLAPTATFQKELQTETDMDSEKHERFRTVNLLKVDELVSQFDAVVNMEGPEFFISSFQHITEDFLRIPEDYYPVLNLADSLNRLRVTIDGNSFSVEPSVVRQSLEALRVKRKEPRKRWTRNIPVQPRFSVQELKKYYSVQRTFPEVYGVGLEGLSEKAPAKRKGQAKQLKAYLYFFEQIMADALAQNANLHRFFSIDPDDDASYQTQLPADIPMLDEVLDLPFSEMEKKLREIANPDEVKYDRRNRVLNHMLARFGEDGIFLDQIHSDLHPKQVIGIKQRLLSQLNELSRFRNRAADVEGVSMLKNRVGILLDFDLNERKVTDFLSEEALAKYLSMSNRFNRLLPSASQANQPTFSFKLLSKSKNFVQKLFKYAADDHSYQIVEGKGKRLAKRDVSHEHLHKSIILRKDRSIEEYDVLLHLEDEVLKLQSVDNMEKAQALIRRLVDRFEIYNRYCEDFFVVEHILLRPGFGELFKYQLFDENGKMMIESIDFSDKKGQKELVFELLEFGEQREAYYVLEDDGMFEVLLLRPDNQKPIGRLVITFPSEEEAWAQAVKAQEYIRRISVSEIRAMAQVEFSSFHSEWATVPSDFFEHTLSIVHPNWTKRFQNTEFLQLFDKLTAESIPSYLKVNRHALSFNEFKHFEKRHEKWRKGMQEENSVRERDANSLKLVHLLTQYATK